MIYISLGQAAKILDEKGADWGIDWDNEVLRIEGEEIGLDELYEVPFCDVKAALEYAGLAA